MHTDTNSNSNHLSSDCIDSAGPVLLGERLWIVLVLLAVENLDTKKPLASIFITKINRESRSPLWPPVS